MSLLDTQALLTKELCSECGFLSYLELERQFPLKVGAQVQTTRVHLICVYLKYKTKSPINANKIYNRFIQCICFKPDSVPDYGDRCFPMLDAFGVPTPPTTVGWGYLITALNQYLLSSCCQPDATLSWFWDAEIGTPLPLLRSHQSGGSMYEYMESLKLFWLVLS